MTLELKRLHSHKITIAHRFTAKSTRIDVGGLQPPALSKKCLRKALLEASLKASEKSPAYVAREGTIWQAIDGDQYDLKKLVDENGMNQVIYRLRVLRDINDVVAEPHQPVEVEVR